MINSTIPNEAHYKHHSHDLAQRQNKPDIGYLTKVRLEL
jgi:hypothetical protein